MEKCLWPLLYFVPSLCHWGNIQGALFAHAYNNSCYLWRCIIRANPASWAVLMWIGDLQCFYGAVNGIYTEGKKTPECRVVFILHVWVYVLGFYKRSKIRIWDSWHWMAHRCASAENEHSMLWLPKPLSERTRPLFVHQTWMQHVLNPPADATSNWTN